MSATVLDVHMCMPNQNRLDMLATREGPHPDYQVAA